MAARQAGYSAIEKQDDDTPSIRLPSLNAGDSSKDIGEDSPAIDRLQTPRRSTSSSISSILGEVDFLKPPGYLTFLHGVALTISLQIGAGIFSTPSQVSQHVPSPGAAVLVWIAAGLLCWTGAAIIIELGVAIPKNGGFQEYLSEIWGDFAGFLCCWTTLVLMRPGSMAVVSMIFSEHLCHIILPSSLESVFASKVVALLGVAVITVINCLGIKSGARTALVFLYIKIFAVISIAVLGIVAATQGKARGVPQSEKGWFGISDEVAWSSPYTASRQYITATFGALYAYGGSSAAGEVAGDLKDPQRDIPRIVNACMAITMVAALSMNIALYEVLPMQAMRDNLIPAVKFGIATMGPAAGIFYSLVVALSAIGSINASLFAGARQYIASAERGYIPGVFGSLHVDRTTQESIYYDDTLKALPSFLVDAVKWFARRTETLRLERRVPVYPTVVSFLLGSVFIIFGTFDGLLVFGGMLGSSFDLLLVVGLYKYRNSQQRGDGSTPAVTYRTWTIIAVSYFIVRVMITVAAIATHPWMALVVIGFFGVGYLTFRFTFLQR